MDRPGFLEPFERVLPEFKAQDVALPRQYVVAHPDAVHRFEVMLDYPPRHVRSELRRFVAALFHRFEGRGAVGQALSVLLVPAGHRGVQVPREVVEPFAAVVQRLLGIAAQDFFEALTPNLPEPDDQVGNLDSGVVDIVLRLDPPAEPLEKPDQGIAEDGVAEMADVRGFIGVDVGVFDDDLALVGRWRGRCARQLGAQKCVAIEESVEVTGPRDLDAFDPASGHKRRGDRGGDVARRPFQYPGEFETDR